MQEKIENFEAFCEAVKENIGTYLPEDYQTIQVLGIQKPNQEPQKALVIIKQEHNTAPAIYLNEWYEKYQENQTLEPILSEIAQSRLLIKEMQNKSVSFLDQYKDRIVLQVVGVSQNKEFLKTVPHTIQGEIAAIYRIDLGQTPEGNRSISVNNEMQEQYKLTTKELHDLAVENTQRLFPPYFENMASVFEKELGAPMPESPLFILTNTAMNQGAAVIFYPQIFERLAETMGKEIYILPSSVHEVLLIKKEDQNVEELNQMVYEINRTQVAPQDRLSDKILEYDFERKQVFAADAPEEERVLEVQHRAEKDQKEKEKREKTREDSGRFRPCLN